jgi:hypothetical protein
MKQEVDKDAPSALPALSGITVGLGAGALTGYIMHNRQLSSVLKGKKVSPDSVAAIERIINADDNLSRVRTNIELLTDMIGDKKRISDVAFTRCKDGKWNAEFSYFPEINSTDRSYKSRSISIENIHWDDLPSIVKKVFQDENKDSMSFAATENLHDVFDKDIKPNLQRMLKRSESHLDAQLDNKLVKEMKLGFKDFHGSQKARVIGSVVAATIVLGMSAYLAVQAITGQRKKPFVERERERETATHSTSQLIV